MKPRCSNQRNGAITLTETVVVAVILAVLAAVFLPALSKAKPRTKKLNCVNLLKQVGLAYKIWEGDDGDKFPMQVSVTKGGSMELAAIGDAASTFLVMSNELSSPKVLVCFADSNRLAAVSFARGLNNSNVSYFVGVDARDEKPESIISGDDNFAVGDRPVKSGLLNLWSNAPATWTAARHHFSGNIGLADGSVHTANDTNLINLLQQTGLATNRLAIP